MKEPTVWVLFEADDEGITMDSVHATELSAREHAVDIEATGMRFVIEPYVLHRGKGWSQPGLSGAA